MAPSFKCLSNTKSEYCFVCAKYTPVKKRKNFTAGLIQKYKKAYNVKNIKNLNKRWTPNIICSGCASNIQSNQSNRNTKLRFATPAIWKRPNANHSNCFICQTNPTPHEKLLKDKLEYRTDLNVKLPQAVKKNLGDFEDSDDDGVLENGKSNSESDAQDESVDE